VREVLLQQQITQEIVVTTLQFLAGHLLLLHRLAVVAVDIMQALMVLLL
jgi:hypothetical protein